MGPTGPQHVKNNIGALIRAQVDAFVNDISRLVREAALAAVEEVLTRATSPTSGPKRATREPAAAGKKPKGRRGRPRKTEVADSAAVLRLVGAAEGGARVEVMVKELGMPSAFMKPAVAELVAAKKVHRVGKARGTKYFSRKIGLEAVSMYRG